ncbi:hypothetical protein M0802_012020 [Mischocyttarus mexicanus]|nr:hypothetical protein M0802_012020 [Mischocyttarus mexicanus]
MHRWFARADGMCNECALECSVTSVGKHPGSPPEHQPPQLARKRPDKSQSPLLTFPCRMSAPWCCRSLLAGVSAVFMDLLETAETLGCPSFLLRLDVCRAPCSCSLRFQIAGGSSSSRRRRRLEIFFGTLSVNALGG